MGGRTHYITLGFILRILGIVVLIIMLSLYMLYQARSFITGPLITLTDTYTPTQNERTMILTGHAENIVQLTLNGREIHTTKEGVFRETLVLEGGYTIIELHARDRFGRTATVRREYVYSPLAT